MVVFFKAGSYGFRAGGCAVKPRLSVGRFEGGTFRRLLCSALLAAIGRCLVTKAARCRVKCQIGLSGGDGASVVQGTGNPPYSFGGSDQSTRST